MDFSRINLHGQIRSCYVNFAEHLLNAFNPNMTAEAAFYRWSDADWRRFIDMVAGFGFNVFEFWLTPKLFSPAGLHQPFGREFARQMNLIIAHAAERGMGVKMLCGLATVGDDWHTRCPNDADEWDAVLRLWDQWTRRLNGLAIVDIFPGDPGACSRNGCTAATFIDKALEVAAIVQRNQPQALIELNTWGNPFFGWGSIQGPPSWRGEFLQSWQHTAWCWDAGRAEASMNHLLKRLPQFPTGTLVAINLGFNPDGDPDGDGGRQDTRAWARQIARTHRIVTWDFSLTEGENAVLPHYRFQRLFAQRRRERAAAPYSGGICYTMTPLLNQLSLYQAAQSFLNPDADPQALTRTFYRRLFGPQAEDLAELLPLFELAPDWGNHTRIDLSVQEYRARMAQGADLLRSLEGQATDAVAFHPHPEAYRQELLFFFELFLDLSSPVPNLTALRQRYWQRVYGIYDHLPQHVDPRPVAATDRLVNLFLGRVDTGPVAGCWS